MPLISADDEMRKAVGAAEEAELAVVVESALGFFDGGFDGEGGGGVRGVVFKCGFEFFLWIVFRVWRIVWILCRG